ncbi:MAG: hypothetical protein AB8G18_14050 [Gammaproteobacteria bacterium]
MSDNQQSYSTVTAVLPKSRSGDVIDDLVSQSGASALMWSARGTLLQDRWWQRLVPPISPAKTMLQMLVPDSAVSSVIDTVVTTGRLHQQATGAVYSTRCDNVYFGSEYHHWPEQEAQNNVFASSSVNQNLGIIYCMVSQERSNRVSRAAIRAGAHGPIVHYCQGRGLRDRLGWLRITKEQHQEILIVLAERRHIEGVFDAMARAGEFHRPGHGLMFRMPVDSGMINLPSRISTHHYDVDMQQIIRAIDHLSGHSHWRDAGLSESSSRVKSQRRNNSDPNSSALRDQIRLSAIVRHSDADAFTDLVLDAGAPGLTVAQTFFAAADEGCQIAGARVNEEYSLYRCILCQEVADHVRRVIEDKAENRGITDVCVYANSVPQVARYVAGVTDHRIQPVSLLPVAPEEPLRES